MQQYIRAKIAEMRNNYDMDSGDTIPKVEISGTNYEVGGSAQLISTIIGYVRMAFFILLCTGQQCFQPFGGLQQMPSIVQDLYKSIEENKIQWGIMAFFIGTMVQNSLLQSGAFEIYVNNNLEFSKLQGGQMPTIEDINAILSRYNINF